MDDEGAVAAAAGGEEVPAARSPQRQHPYACPSLRQLCSNTLTAYRAYLGKWVGPCASNIARHASATREPSGDLFLAGDVGFIDVESLRAVCSHCNKDQLAAIEDGTR